MKKEKRLTIAFDVDDCLLLPSVATGLDIDTPNYDNIDIFRYFQAQGHDMVVWSGSGMDYASRWAEKLGLRPCIVLEKRRYDTFEPDICFDDCDVDLAKVNIKVKRLNNSISRKEWNKKGAKDEG